MKHTLANLIVEASEANIPGAAPDATWARRKYFHEIIVAAGRLPKRLVTIDENTFRQIVNKALDSAGYSYYLHTGFEDNKRAGDHRRISYTLSFTSNQDFEIELAPVDTFLKKLSRLIDSATHSKGTYETHQNYLSPAGTIWVPEFKTAGRGIATTHTFYRQDNLKTDPLAQSLKKNTDKLANNSYLSGDPAAYSGLRLAGSSLDRLVDEILQKLQDKHEYHLTDAEFVEWSCAYSWDVYCDATDGSGTAIDLDQEIPAGAMIDGSVCFSNDLILIHPTGRRKQFRLEYQSLTLLRWYQCTHLLCWQLSSAHYRLGVQAPLQQRLRIH